MNLFLICVDLSASIIEQVKQMSYWLDFLNSSLDLPPPSVPPHSNWGILIVGLKADLLGPSAPKVKPDKLASWKAKWARLPILNEEFYYISSTKSGDSVQHILKVVEYHIDRILSQHALQVPTIFKSILASIQMSSVFPSAASRLLTTEADLYENHGKKMDRGVFSNILHYFHAIGDIVCIKGGIVCTVPHIVPKIAAKFVSPQEISISLLKDDEENLQILTETDVGYILDIGSHANDRYIPCLH